MRGRYSWLRHIPKICAEDCQRVDAKTAPAENIPTARYENIPGVFQTRCVCPRCQKLVHYLYRVPAVQLWDIGRDRQNLPLAPDWACAACHEITRRSRTRSGTKSAMRKSLARDREDYRRLFLGEESDVSFDEFQKYRHRSYNRKRARNSERVGNAIASATTNASQRS